MANINEYIDGRDRIFGSLAGRQLGCKEINTHRFNLVSANLLKFMPQIPFHRHTSIYKDIVLHNQLSHFEQLYQDTFDWVTTENLSPELMQLIREKPCILSSFHFGSYRLLNTFLIRNKIPYTIVIPKATLEKEGETLRKIYANGGEDDSRFIELESPALGLKMIRELKKGRSLFIYFDGNRGSGNIKDTARDASEGKIGFLGQTIFARKGVAYLAHTAGVPLITAICYRRSAADIRLHFFEPVIPDLSVNKDLFAQETTQMIYDRFVPFLKEYPGQWEPWLYLHKSIDAGDGEIEAGNEGSDAGSGRTDSGNGEFDARHGEMAGAGLGESMGSERVTEAGDERAERWALNPLSYGVFRIGSDPFLFNKNTYKTYPIDDPTYELLFRSSEEHIGRDELSGELFRQLSREKVLEPCGA